MNKKSLEAEIKKMIINGKEKGWKIGFYFDKQPIKTADELIKIASKNKFRGKIIPRPMKNKGTLYIEYQKGLTGLQKMAGGSGATISGR